jgi:hypothetical protein
LKLQRPRPYVWLINKPFLASDPVAVRKAAALDATRYLSSFATANTAIGASITAPATITVSKPAGQGNASAVSNTSGLSIIAILVVVAQAVMLAGINGM